MPQRAFKPCLYPLCKNLVSSNRFCIEHAKEDVAVSALSEAKPIYHSVQWRKLRLLHLRSSPLCAVCQQPAVVADHITPIRQGGHPWAMENLQSLCLVCHSKKRNMESQPDYIPKFQGSFTCPVTLVCGAPGSGKSYYVRAHMLPDDLVIDLDYLVQALSWQPLYAKPFSLVSAALIARNAVLQHLCTPNIGLRHAWIISGAPLLIERQKFKIAGASVVLIASTEASCLARIGNDPQRKQNCEAWRSVVQRWFEKHQPDVVK